MDVPSPSGDPGAGGASSPRLHSAPAYELIRELGRGAMGVVYLAEHKALRRQVAIKVLSRLDDATVLARFLREGEALARVEHPHVVRIFEAGEVNGCPFLVLENMPGGTLRDRLRQHGRLPMPDALRIAIECLSGLEACHARSIVHRDVKPPNILFTAEGIAKVADLGIAKLLDETIRLTRTGMTLGSPIYMSPEQIRGQAAGPASDLYAMGVMLYEMLSGRPPLEGANAGELYVKHMNVRPEPLGARVEGLPEALVEVVHDALAKQAGDRPPSAAAFAARLRRVLEAPAPDATGPTARASARTAAISVVSDPPASRRRAVLATGLLLAALAVTAALVVRPAPEPVLPVPSSPAASPSPRSPTLFEKWKDHRALLPTLRAGGEAARRAVRTMRDAAGFDTTADGWVYWLEVGPWIAAGGGSPPRSKRAVAGRMDEADCEMFRVALRDLSDHRAPERVGIALRFLAWRPDDARTWFLLGRILDLDGDAAGARVVYRAGLRKLRPGEFMADITLTDQFVWQGVARALMLEPSTFESAWLSLLPAGAHAMAAWEGLRAVLLPARRQAYLDLLAGARRIARTGDVATSLLSAQEADPARQLELLRAGLARHPGSSLLAAEVGSHLERIGAVDEVRQIWPAMPAGEVRGQLPGPWFGPSRRSPLPAELAARVESEPYLLKRELFGRIEAGDRAGAEELYTRAAHRFPDTRLALDLLGIGSAHPAIVKRCRELLVLKATPDAWLYAAGALATTAGRPAMQAFLDEAGACPELPVHVIALARALWLSRCGEIAASLDGLEAWNARFARSGWRPWPELNEIATRPAWMKHLGGAVSDALVGRAAGIAAAMTAAGDPFAGYGRAVRDGDLAAAARIARELRSRFASAPLVALVPAWWSLSSRDARAVSAALECLRAMGGEQLAGAWILRSLLLSPPAPGPPAGTAAPATPRPDPRPSR